ncbi:MAG: Asp-tRNA(Asn)/Glu-tRNA(Gln) amidotransferase subunit GatA [Burkholderiales bacterium]|nr:Asp-tRNA(Asn)/Glu-tRNA(Gln) amidotransferase subunit GatA [Burkholderiales bacterium]MCA3161246.1 Asp-tRNA(Asn)/Glu-tRNA(Gln) amidotransferase subunit GatA [Burkholderiales bacterium]MCA3164178.1 Asp-tRNA(Asn)/Glu-tRNA(Gln) amidotransferase subunit GatA [Burkholderiales bacterium]MCA3165941.1 Asp-tRNA(Asn)/Glu-tRNA(Gln) amidotransferase subunit GatA [Burkholderiales bacterium]MCA3170813.1 Asp-tRNA(Asn)/Glu-tRNA(Gln) amidotransferase subunit GatA [Burkholderiales bacterium]
MVKTLVELSRLLAQRQVSALELAQDALRRAEQYQDLNAYLDLRPEVTLAQARAADVRIAQGQATPLTGIPVAHKDIFVTRDFASTAGSRMLHGYRSPFDATVVEQLAQAGMVTVGKLNCDEFAMGSTNENSAYGAVLNPWDKQAVPGGSSGGSSAAVAAGLVPVATATDTGGSIRQPASFCGVTGIKPTYGRASRWGMIAFASSLDQAGIMTRSAEDAALVFNAMLGFDPKDSTSINRSEEDYTRLLQQPVKGLRIGLPKEFFASGLPPEVEQPIRAALTQLEQLGAILVDISLPNIALGIPAYYVIAPAEASSNLSRFDGVRYGHRAEHYQDLIDMMKRSRAEGFGPEPKRRIMIGTYVLSHGYYDAYFLQAQKVRRLIAEDFQAAFEQCDLIAGPNAASEAWNLNAKVSDPVEMYLSDLFTIPGSLAGLPGMSVPCGFASTTGRPVGLQLMANHFAEAQLLGVAHQYQLATDWHLRRPGGFAE